MATLEERVAYLEGKVEEHSHAFPAVQDAIGRLDARFESRFAGLEHRMDTGFDAVNRRMDASFDAVNRRFEVLEHRMDTGLKAADDKMSKHFLWIIGIQITMFVALLGALLART